MKKTTKIILIAVSIIAIIAAIVSFVLINSKPKTNLEPITSAEDLSALVDKIYEGETLEMPGVMTQIIDITDKDWIKSITGLDSAENLEYVVASEPMMSSQAYSLVLVKVKDGVNSDEIAKQMNENIDARKWICVSAEKVYSTSSADVVCLVMSREELAKPIFEKFKTLAGNVGSEYEKSEETPELPEDMY